MGWLTQAAVEEDARALVARLVMKAKPRSSRGRIRAERDVAIAMREWSVGACQIQGQWFFASLGVVDVLDGRTKDTYYLSKASNAYFFCLENVVPWTNWLGSLYVRMKEALKQGPLPREVKYGPPNRLKLRPVGPVVDYSFVDGRLESFQFSSPLVPVPVTSPPPSATVGPPAEAHFGLKEIIRTIDLAQDGHIRGPMDGIFVLIGGPGVGKTTVALHRIPYLINEQTPHDDPKTPPPAREEVFFTQRDTLVVVWKEHLVPYLRSCLQQLDLTEVKATHVEDWVSAQLRRYVSFGKGPRGYHVAEGDEEVEAAKLQITEAEIRRFIVGRHPSAAASRDAFGELVNDVRVSFRRTGSETAFTVRPGAYVYTVPGIIKRTGELLNALSHAEEDIGHEERRRRDTGQPLSPLNRARAAVAKGKQKATGFRREQLRRIRGSYPEMLEGLYRSQVVLDMITGRFGDGFARAFDQSVQEQFERRILSPTDRHILLWLIDSITRGSKTKESGCAPLPEYCHVLIDEAQYYHPLMLRLFARLTRAPYKSMTIVGDLEQRISSKGGILNWDDMRLKIPSNRIARLVTNYRWSRRVFEFLATYRRLAALATDLQEPFGWPSGDGIRPDVAGLQSRDDELDWLVRRVCDLKSAPMSSHFTIAVILPGAAVGALAEGLVQELTSCDLRSRWASGEDVKESTEQVVLTDYDSIVGLEFDAIFVAACDEVFRATPLSEASRSVWVALTRARQYVGVTYVGECPILGQEEFSPYCSQ